MSWLWFIWSAFAADVSDATILTYQIGAGDMLSVEVIGEEDMSREVRVAADGSLEIPLAGRIPVEGLTVDGATRAITEYLSGRYLVNPQVVIKVEEFASKPVDVSGGVLKPATYHLVSGHTRVSEMLLAAGGLVDAATPVAVIRREVGGQWTEIKVSLERVNRGDFTADVEILAGDQVYVPPVERVFVQGQVSAQGAVPYQDGITISQAVIIAGGATPTAKLSGAYIIRDGQTIKVNLKRVRSGEEADLTLRPSDTIVIPESAF